MSKSPAAVSSSSANKESESELWSQYWANPDNKAPLHVLADLWLEQGDPRGEFVQLSLLESPTAAQLAKRKTMREKMSGKLVGPAKPHITAWHFGPDGLLESAITDAERWAAGRAEIENAHPRLALTVSVKKIGGVKKLVEKSLERVYWPMFGTQLTDKKLALLAPALKQTRNLTLDGRAQEYFTAAGLANLADHLEALESLELIFLNGMEDDRRPYIDVLANHPGFRKLKVLTLENAEPDEVEPLKRLPNLVQLFPRWTWRDPHPKNATELERAKRGEPLAPSASVGGA